MVYPCVVSSVDAHACGAVLKRKRRVAFESHCSGAAYVQLDPAIADVYRDRTSTERKGRGVKGNLRFAHNAEVVSSTGSADGWQSVSASVVSGSVSCGCSCRCEGGVSCDEAPRVR